MQLEDRIKRFGYLPDTIFYQVDGGSENANIWTLAICEFLIAKRLTKRIYLTRLLVGHTHEDIDGKFGHLWYYIRLLFVLTMQVTFFILFYCRLKRFYSFQMYERILRNVFGKGKIGFDVKNIFIVPNYKEMLKCHVDNKLVG